MQHILKAARDLLEIINRELADPNLPPPKTEPSLVPPISCDVLYIEDDLVNSLWSSGSWNSGQR